MAKWHMSRQVRIATRRSRLALWQAEHVAARLAACHPGLVVSLVPIVTEGDRIQDRSLAAAGGKGLFIKELENALQDGRADIAVHSMKDMPAALPAGFAIAAALERGDPRDAFVSPRHASLAALPGAPASGHRACAGNASCDIAGPTSKSWCCAATSTPASPSSTLAHATRPCSRRRARAARPRIADPRAPRTEGHAARNWPGHRRRRVPGGARGHREPLASRSSTTRRARCWPPSARSPQRSAPAASLRSPATRRSTAKRSGIAAAGADN